MEQNSTYQQSPSLFFCNRFQLMYQLTVVLAEVKLPFPFQDLETRFGVFQHVPLTSASKTITPSPPPPEAWGCLEGRHRPAGPASSSCPRSSVVLLEWLVRKDWARGRDRRRIERQTVIASLVRPSAGCVRWQSQQPCEMMSLLRPETLTP